MAETRRLAAIMAADVVGFSRMTSADEDRTLARLRALRSDLIDPTIAVHNGRVFKRTGDGALVEFRSVVDAVRCAIEVQNAMVERNAGVAPERRIEFRIGIHLGDVVEESDGDLMGDGINIAARLEGIAQPGAICLSEDAFRQVKGRLDIAVSDLGPTRLKNIAEPMRAYGLQVGTPATAIPAAPSKPQEGRKRPALGMAVAAILASVVVASGAWYFLSHRKSPAEAAHLSIVVLPFTNLSNDPAQDYFADGITENLTTDLSRIRGSFVIARNTAFTFKGKASDAKEIGRQLAVRYVLEGSVQRDQNRVRVNAQLIDAESGAHLWADRFEEDFVDLFKLQDQVVARLGNTLGFELLKAEATRSARSENPDAIDLDMRGRALNALAATRPVKERLDSYKAALTLLDQALAIDPNNADALADESFDYFNLFNFGGLPPETDYEAKVLGQANRSLALAPDNTRAYFVKAYYLSLSRRADEGLRAADAGLAVNPNYAPLYAARGFAEMSLGRFEPAKSDTQQAMRLSPRDPSMGAWHCHLGDEELGLGHFDAAIEQQHAAIDAGFRVFVPYVSLAAAYAVQGKTEEAKPHLAEARRLEPKLTFKWLTEHGLPGLQFEYESLRKAGLPEE